MRRRAADASRCSADKQSKPQVHGDWVQVGRQGNPLFNEALVAIEDKDLYSRTRPTSDRPAVPQVRGEPRAREAAQPDRVRARPARDRDGPDRHCLDLHPRRDQGGPLQRRPRGWPAADPTHPSNPDDPGFSRLSIFGGDVLISQIQPGFGGGAIPGGWPNGRRFGDDVVDIAVTAPDQRFAHEPSRHPRPRRRQRQRERHGLQQGLSCTKSTPQNGRRHVHH